MTAFVASEKFWPGENTAREGVKFSADGKM
jgi:hypothetical protein